MPHALVLQFPSPEALPSALLSRLPEPDYADEKCMRFIVEEGFSLSEADAALLSSRQIDHVVLPDMAFGELGLIVSDMDSTLITIECVDEIAAGVGLKDRVAEITERSMRGELDFEQSLRSRVALLAGVVGIKNTGWTNGFWRRFMKTFCGSRPVRNFCWTNARRTA